MIHTYVYNSLNLAMFTGASHKVTVQSYISFGTFLAMMQLYIYFILEACTVV